MSKRGKKRKRLGYFLPELHPCSGCGGITAGVISPAGGRQRDPRCVWCFAVEFDPMDDLVERRRIELANLAVPGLDFGRPKWRSFLSRIDPRVWRGRQVDGHVASYTEVPLLEEIMCEHGGGKYRLRVQWGTKYVGHATAEIAGDPHGEVSRAAPPPLRRRVVWIVR